MIDSTLAMLGHRAKDVVTGFEGVISSVTFDLYGCVQGLVTPAAKDGKPGEPFWFDIKRLELGSKVMEAPQFTTIKRGAERGAAEKPVPRW